MDPKRTFRYYYLTFTRLKGSPQSLASGAAIGNIFLALPFSIAGYFLSLRLFISVHDKKNKKYILTMQSLTLFSTRMGENALVVIPNNLI